MLLFHRKMLAEQHLSIFIVQLEFHYKKNTQILKEFLLVEM
jgi:hypothetical protein